MKNLISKRQRNRLRKLVCESLEPRQLMAADMVHHNFMMPEDSDMSGNVNPLDALMVINRLNTQIAGGQMNLTGAVDVDADGTLSPLDALTVINFINRGLGQDEIQISQVSVQNRIDRLDEALDADLLPPNVDLAMATQIREILRAGGFPEIGDRMVNGVLSRQVQIPSSLSGNELNAGATKPDLTDLLGSLDLFGVDLDFPGLTDIGRNDDPTVDFEMPPRSEVNDPTNDNGNGAFLDSQAAAPIVDFVEIELRKQLKVSDDATIRIAVFNNPGQVTSGTWFYLTKEGIGVSGNWSYTQGKPETLNLFRSNVDIEKRIYVQYPGSAFIYYSWLPDAPFGYYFSPIGDALDFKPYFDGLPGSEFNSFGGFASYSGELEVFAGIGPIEQQASTLYAIDKSIRGN